MREIADFVGSRLAALADPATAAGMAAYMKTSMPCYGVKTGPRREIAREAAKAFPARTRREYEDAVLALWERPHREEKYTAITIARTHRKFVGPESLGLYERIVREGAWWDFVDETAVHLVGASLSKSPDEVWPVMDRWIDDPDMWIRRTAILCQNAHRGKTDEARLFGYCLRRAHEKEFFVRKAIGWALRSYAYTAPDAVRRFLAEHGPELSPLSVREAGKHL